MLPYSLRNDVVSFTDKKWDWRQQIKRNGLVEDENHTLFEIKPSGAIKEHKCQIEKA